MPLEQLNNIDIFYQILGSENTETVLLVSGLGSQMTSWSESFCQELVQKGFRVIRFDNRDSGCSSFIENEAKNVGELIQFLQQGKFPKGAYSLLDIAKDALALLDFLKIEKAHIFGRSMGGIIVQLMASEFPERVLSATIIMSTSLRPDLPQAQPDVMQMMLSPMPDFNKEPQAFLEKRLTFIKAISGTFSIDEKAETEIINKEKQRAPSANILGQICAMTITGFDVKRLEKINAPSLVVHGTEDPIFPLACGEDISNAIPHSTLLKIEGMGHSIPTVLNEKIIQAFLKMNNN
ncbi:alpha/beta fold hydrolase [Flavobacterium cerinum]|uniref:Alpha/beta hydrolase n=1 Tax=Flavobacterium cerinum TaxID=2502784 RepID=A0A3S3QLB7_9FLAO|nr:alpha/beta hydrolase [Flavobacterium cerinum]RWW91748.1 alpha/beta hydrolase [Flavobacterium cerinum]